VGEVTVFSGIKLPISAPVFALGALAFVSTSFADDAQVQEGAELYAEFCENCHGADKSGLGEYNADLAAFTERLEGLTEEMPDFAGFFDEEEIVAMHAYLVADDIAAE
jgi:mono/diheme cytochrome c family protein